MATSLSDLLGLSGESIRLVVQPDRRQASDRRHTWRGGRRATDRGGNIPPVDATAAAGFSADTVDGEPRIGDA
jgi:hypothetical protein